MGARGIELLEHGIADLCANPKLVREDLILLARLARQVDAVFATVVGEFDRSGGWALDGRKSMAGWLESQAAMTPSEAQRTVRRAKFAEACPVTRARWASGAIATEKLDRIAALRHAAKDDAAFTLFEPSLLGVAMHGTIVDLATAAHRWRDALEADRQTDDTKPNHQIEREHLFVSETFGGMGVLRGEFTPENREQIETALDREMDRLHIAGDSRTVSQLRAEALASIMRQYNSQAINAATNQPHISIHIDEPTWTGTAVGHCETARGMSLSRDTVARVACNAEISIITHAGDRIPLSMHRAQRTFTKHQRRALEHRDTCCRYPGCARPVTATEAHHVEWWELGGETNLENAAMLCYFHHRLVHEGKWTIKIDADATIKWFKPDGSYYATSYPRPPTTPLPIK